MKTGTKVFLVIFVLIIAGAAVIGIDVYLSWKTYQDNPGAFSYSTPTLTLAPDNSTVSVNTTITTPKLGYIPKSARIDVVIMNGTTQFGDTIQITIKLGVPQSVQFSLNFTMDVITHITGGGTISLTAEVTATPIYIGIPLKFLAQDLGVIDIDLP